MAVGTPPQYTQFILNTLTPETFVFAKGMFALVMDQPDKFYNDSTSTTFKMTNSTSAQKTEIGL